MTTKKKSVVPAGLVLISSSSDSFTYEVFHDIYSAGDEVEAGDLENGRKLRDGQSVEITEKFRHDGPGEPRDHTITDMRVTNRGGKAVVEELGRVRR